MTRALLPPHLLSHWSAFAGASVQGFGNGLINSTFLVEGRQSRAVLQRLHPVFAGVVNEDIEAVTAHLERKRMLTPRLVRTDTGALFVEDDEGRPWRMLSFVEGTSLDSLSSPSQAFEAAAMLGRFHVGVSDLDWEYRHVRGKVHDTPRHLAVLAEALREHPTHRLFDTVAPIAEEILERSQSLPDFSALPLRHSHGDPKISNVLFDEKGHALCLVDLDTVGKLALPYELGDALRSWCNPAGEDASDNALSPELFAATIEGYASVARRLVSEAEQARIVDGLSVICLELASRFLADALNESYFGWNPARFASRGEHNLLRARGQWALHKSVEAQRASLELIVSESFAR